MSVPHLSKIRIYPMKSLDPVELTEAEIGVRSLRFDREFAMLALDGKFVNGKRTGRVNELKAQFDLKKGVISLSPRTTGAIQQFELREKNRELEAYLSEYFDTEIVIVHRTKGELMDIPGTSSITVLSEASLQSVQRDIGNGSLENIRLRFRANLELSGVDPYWEDQLFKGNGEGVAFKIGDVNMIGVSPRARCNVPPKDPLTGETNKTFVKQMMQSRERNLPADSNLKDYGHFYHLTVNTYLSESEKGKILRVGDPIEILASIPFIS